MLSELWIDTELTLFIFTSFYNVQKVMIYNRKQHGCPGVDYYGNMASDTYLSEIIPKNPVTLRFLKVSSHELKFSCKTFQLSH